ncbi:uncharacterized protein LOC130624275 [Hydractinia symbiolongicarpus]|uniref:uncharacterized protein LOC130624275 n=1 Tax=Hydractinia symbiolongicarpus TaxID=13093 RepID=UPI00254F25B3|nr:uncharacterized protein LOC130624275 [Hydractinia symbiolongicarpus]
MGEGRSNFYFKFPRTRHVFDAGGNGVSRDDLIMSEKERKAFLQGKKIIVEEKIDGANLGISINRNHEILTQNRAHYINSSSHRQFGALDSWVSKHSADLHQILQPGKHILFGEWMVAKHSIHYVTLPDYFLAFDIYDKQERRFLSVQNRNELLASTEISTVRYISSEENLDEDKLLKLLETKSQFYDGFVEGLVLRIDEDETGVSDVFSKRAKVVRPDFLQQIEEQWTKQKYVKNRMACYY